MIASAERSKPTAWFLIDEVPSIDARRFLRAGANSVMSQTAIND